MLISYGLATLFAGRYYCSVSPPYLEPSTIPTKEILAFKLGEPVDTATHITAGERREVDSRHTQPF